MDNDIQATLSQKMREDFIARLPDRLDTLKTLLADLECGRPESLQTLQRAAHSLAGSAGGHRLIPVSEAARNLEQIVAAIPADGILDEQALDAMRKALAHLEAQTVKPGYSLVPQTLERRNEVPRIVIMDDDREQADWLRAMLEQAGYRVDVFHELAAFGAASLASEPPAAVIMDMMFPEGDDAGARVIANLKERDLNSFPVIFTSVRQDMAAKLAAYRAGATCYLTKPVDIAALLRAVADSAALAPGEPFRVLLVDDDPDQLTAHGLILRQAGMTVLETGDPFQVPEILEDFAVEVLVLDMVMPECSGPELATILRDDQRYAQTPIIYLSAETCVSPQLLALNSGGDHFLTEPVDPRHLVATVALHARRFRQSREQAESLRAALYERERQQQALDAHAIVSAADAAGIIIYVNDRFCEISGYSRNELLGQNHRIVKSSEHLAEFYRDMWRTIARGNIWRGEVCNRRKDGSLYWVETSIVPFLDDTGRPYQYVSIRTDISHIKETELRLRIMERAIDASSSCVLIADAGQSIMPLIYVNPAFERVTGYSRDEAVGRNARFLHGKEIDQPGLDKIRAVLREGCAGEALLHNYRKDGTPYWNDLRIAPVHDEQGRLTHFIGISDDVTERREAGDALRKSEERLRRSQLYANIGTWDWNIQTGELFCSERIASLFGYPDITQHNYYKNYFNNVHPEDRQLVSVAIDACLQQGAEFNIEFRCVWPGGTIRWLLERGDVVRDKDGAPLNMLGVVQDITDRKLVELKSLEQQAKLVIFKHIIENVADGVITIDSVGAIRSFNPAAERLFGYSAAEVINSNVKLLMPEPYRSEHDQYLARHMAGQPAGIIGKQVELPGQHKDGTVFLMGLTITAMEIDNAKNFVGILRDISERKQYERDIISARDDAERANSAKSEFLSSMSHELRTPMNAILGFGQLLEIDDMLNEEQVDCVNEILKAGRHLLELINEVLDLAKIESGKVNLSLEALPCAELIRECLTLVRPIAQVQGIAINDSAIGNYAVCADRTRLKQVLLNLLSNAIKYNRPQGAVSVQAAVQKGLVRVAVSDTGYGIPASRQQELFQPFSRLGAEDTAIEGTGIGLTICSRLIEMMGGAIGVESKEGQGSTFWIELPEVASEPGAGDIDLKQAMAAETTVGGERRYTVLYIEDNPANLRLVTQILGRNPQLQLITAYTPELGLELISARHPDLILLDINLPGMDGYQVLSILRSLDSVKQTPVIAISANATPRDIERGMAAGFNDYITKPIDVMHFLEAVDRLLP
ncbi:MAG: PAS domain S-box protein [Methylobacter sp.]|jgi:PAS domain S-box-containing protein|nr:PAS domain S-box protein [Methylobacter sp.]